MSDEDYARDLVLALNLSAVEAAEKDELSIDARLVEGTSANAFAPPPIGDVKFRMTLGYLTELLPEVSLPRLEAHLRACKGNADQVVNNLMAAGAASFSPEPPQSPSAVQRMFVEARKDAEAVLKAQASRENSDPDQPTSNHSVTVVYESTGSSPPLGPRRPGESWPDALPTDRDELLRLGLLRAPDAGPTHQTDGPAETRKRHVSSSRRQPGSPQQQQQPRSAAHHYEALEQPTVPVEEVQRLEKQLREHRQHLEVQRRELESKDVVIKKQESVIKSLQRELEELHDRHRRELHALQQHHRDVQQRQSRSSSGRSVSPPSVAPASSSAELRVASAPTAAPPASPPAPGPVVAAAAAAAAAGLLRLSGSGERPAPLDFGGELWVTDLEKQTVQHMISVLNADRSRAATLLRFMRTYDSDVDRALDAVRADLTWRQGTGSGTAISTQTAGPASLEDEPFWDSSPDVRHTRMKLQNMPIGSFFVRDSWRPGCVALVYKRTADVGIISIWCSPRGYSIEGDDTVYSRFDRLLRTLRLNNTLSAAFSHPDNCGCVRSVGYVRRRPVEREQRTLASVPSDGIGIRHLPDEILVAILQYVTDLPSFLAASQVCRHWNSLSWTELRCFPDYDPLIWKVHPKPLIKFLSKRCPSLWQLVVPRAASMDVQALPRTTFAKTLKSLSLHALTEVPSWNWIPPEVCCLSLAFVGAQLTQGFSLAEFARLQRVQWMELAFFNCAVNFNGKGGLLPRLESLPSLRKLALTAPKQGGDLVAFCDLSSLLRLRELHLYCDVPFAVAPSLRRLLLSNVYSTACLQSLHMLTHLETLEVVLRDASRYSIKQPDLDAATLNLASICGNLVTLRLPRLTGLLRLASAFPRLEHLALPDTHITDAELRDLALSCRRLRRVYISNPDRLTDACLPTLVGLAARLESLTVVFDLAADVRISPVTQVEIASLCHGTPWDGFSDGARADLACYTNSVMTFSRREREWM